MPMTLKVGLTRKLGQPDFGSLGASCDVQLELDGALLFANPDALQEKIRSAYAACERAITAELARQTHQEVAPDVNGSANGNGRHNRNGHFHKETRQSPPDGPRSPRRATSSQIRALYAIANRQSLNLTEVLRDRCRVYKAEELSISQASQLIDELKAAHSGANGGHG